MGVYVILEVYLKPGEEKYFEQTYDKVSQRLHGKIAGQVSDELLKPTQVGAPYILLSRWQSVEAHQAWTATEQHRTDVAPLRQHWERTVSREFLTVREVEI